LGESWLNVESNPDGIFPRMKHLPLWKLIGIWLGGWMVLIAAFVAYVSFAPHDGGFTQRSLNLIAGLGGMIFGAGLIVVIATKFGGLFPKSGKEKNYYDESTG
jgi:hypothetical protein